MPVSRTPTPRTPTSVRAAPFRDRLTSSSDLTSQNHRTRGGGNAGSLPFLLSDVGGNIPLAVTAVWRLRVRPPEIALIQARETRGWIRGRGGRSDAVGCRQVGRGAGRGRGGHEGG